MSVVFFSYSHKDEVLRNELETHLITLKRQGVIETWHDRCLKAGDHLDHSIDAELERADIILLLVSADFLASDYCYGVEMMRAMERHAIGSARVIPVILRPCDWRPAPFGKLLATPIDGKPVTKYASHDDAFLEITQAIRAAAHTTSPPKPTSPLTAVPPVATPTLAPASPRSSNLRVRREFTERDHHLFLEDSYEYMARFFENSLRELAMRNRDTQTDFKRIDANRFTAVAYKMGLERSRCQIRLGGMMGQGITFSHGRLELMDNSINESMSAVAGEQSLALRPLGMPMRGREGHNNLSAEGASEYYWDLFIEPLQR